ncbi:DUF3906 family protein [Evansella sp. AB-P1]|uniref:DUF3906 family protein n=1 Tax=Evansella sp. AB-P1 TaxID=3037653 RepID=UPI00241E516B|nr:DUF3906 family protein [Evansella sp. AB-P1]MDG5787835.1 DUF3906 family protein [Evansella sp. AB-P1]
MTIFRFEAVINNDRTVDIIIAAEDEESAFKLAEMELERHYLKLPVIDELTLYEKRKISKGGGFVLERENLENK